MGLLDRLYDDYVWAFKYRPTTLDEMILPDHLRMKFDAIIKRKKIGNLLLHGDSGLGKTTIAAILVEVLDRDALYINASKENGIETIRGKLDKYCSKVCFETGVKRLAILDEFDGLSLTAEKSLKVLIEEYGANCEFIFITNFVMEISSKMKSRLQDVCFDNTPDSKKLMKQGTAKLLLRVCEAENVKYDKRGISKIVNEYYPDIRKVLNEAQNIADYGGVTEEIVMHNIHFSIKEFMDAIQNKNFTEINKIVANLKISPARIFSILSEKGLERIDPNSRGEFILLISEYLHKAEHSTQPNPHIKAFCISVMNEIKVM